MPQVRPRVPGRWEVKSKWVPSGDHRGFELSYPALVKRWGAPPSDFTTQTSLCRLFSLSRTVVTVNATYLPSGDVAGEPTVVTLNQSPGVKARGACADAPPATRNRAVTVADRNVAIEVLHHADNEIRVPAGAQRGVTVSPVIQLRSIAVKRGGTRPDRFRSAAVRLSKPWSSSRP
jgi:hypothetical protein